MNPKYFINLTFSILVIFINFDSFGEVSIKESRNTIDEWARTRQIISKEKSQWELEKDLLKKSQALLSSELARLNLELKDLKESATASDEERISLASKKESLKAASKVVESSIGKLEESLKRIIPSLPSPLLEKIRPLLRRLPDDPLITDLSLGERVQNIVGILNETDKFNTTITIKSEVREFETGKSVQVSTIYIGLATAYFVDESGKYSGIGIPTNNGWEWPLIEKIGPNIKQLLEIYEGTAEIKFIQTPAQTINL